MKSLHGRGPLNAGMRRGEKHEVLLSNHSPHRGELLNLLSEHSERLSSSVQGAFFLLAFLAGLAAFFAATFLSGFGTKPFHQTFTRPRIRVITDSSSLMD